MQKHTHLPTMVSFVGKHIAEHFRSSRPRPRPPIPAKFLDPPPIAAERVTEHFRTSSGTLRQTRASLLRRAMRAAKLSRNLQVRSGQPDPLAANIVHVSKDRSDGTNVAGRFRSPYAGVKMLDEHLVD